LYLLSRATAARAPNTHLVARRLLLLRLLPSLLLLGWRLCCNTNTRHGCLKLQWPKEQRYLTSPSPTICCGDDLEVR